VRGSVIALRIAQKKNKNLERGVVELIRYIESNPQREASFFLPHLKELIE